MMSFNKRKQSFVPKKIKSFWDLDEYKTIYNHYL